MVESRGDEVYGEIITRILSGMYRPGTMVNRREVAASLGYSISPVNEAFTVLASQGIVETVPRKGTFIARLDTKDIRDLTIVRAGLECQAARIYCGRTIASLKEELLPLARTVDEAASPTWEFLKADIEFHRSLVRAAHVPPLASIFESVITKSLLLCLEADMMLLEESTPGMSHVRLLEELATAQPDAAEKIIRRYVFAGKPSLFREQSEHPEREASNGTDGGAGPLDLILRNLESR